MPVRQQVGRSHAFVANDPNQPIPHSFWELRRPLYGEICVSFLVYTHKRSTWQKNWSRWVTQHTIQSVWWVCYLKKRSGQLAARRFSLVLRQIICLCQQGDVVGKTLTQHCTRNSGRYRRKVWTSCRKWGPTNIVEFHS